MLQAENLNDSGDREWKKSPKSDRLCQLSRMVCFDHAITLAKILKYHHMRFNGRRMLFHAVGHADVCATTLFMTLVHTKDSNKRKMSLGYLQAVSEVLKALGSTYVLAEQLFQTLTRALDSWRDNVLVNHISKNPVLRESQYSSSYNMDNFVSPTALPCNPGFFDDMGTVAMPPVHNSFLQGSYDSLGPPGIDAQCDIGEDVAWNQELSWDVLLNEPYGAIPPTSEHQISVVDAARPGVDRLPMS